MRVTRVIELEAKWAIVVAPGVMGSFFYKNLNECSLALSFSLEHQKNRTAAYSDSTTTTTH